MEVQYGRRDQDGTRFYNDDIRRAAVLIVRSMIVSQEANETVSVKGAEHGASRISGHLTLQQCLNGKTESVFNREVDLDRSLECLHVTRYFSANQ